MVYIGGSLNMKLTFSREQVSQRRALVSAGDRVCQAFLEPCEGLGASPDDLGAAWRPDEVGWVDPSSLRESLRWQRQLQKEGESNAQFFTGNLVIAVSIHCYRLLEALYVTTSANLAQRINSPILDREVLFIRTSFQYYV